MNFSILYGGRLSNQLILLYHIYNKYENIEKIYAPNFEIYGEYFNIDKLCDNKYYNDNSDSFTEIQWNREDLTILTNYCDVKFNDLKLKKKYYDVVQNILKDYNQYDNLISVHIRQTDFKTWYDGLYYFEYEDYMKKCYEEIEKLKIENYKILVFSDTKQNVKDEDSVFISDKTNFGAPIDLFIMSNCNYFISTWSTFSIMAVNLSKGMNKFKSHYIMDKK